MLAKDADSDAFEAILRLPERQKLVFKFVINGSDWVTDDSYKIEHDEHGNPNNYVDAYELIEVQEFTKDATPTDPVSEPVPVAAKSTEPSTKTAEPTDAAKPAAVETTTEGSATKSAELAHVSEPAAATLAPQFLPAAVHDKPEVVAHDDEERLTNVLTSGSSYAAVSVPESEGSGFENISRNEEQNFDASNRLARNRTAPEDITPTTSNTGGAAAAKQGSTGATQDSEVTTLGPNSRNSSFTGRPHQPDGETVDIVKIPGSLPLPSKTEEKRLSRRDGLITRLKGIFRS